MKRKTISAKRVLNELLAEQNDQQIAYSYARATGDHETTEQCQSALHAIFAVINGLGFKEGIDYDSRLQEKTIINTTFTYWHKFVIE